VCALIREPPTKGTTDVILLGVVLLIIGFITSIQIIWILGIIAVVVGAIIAIAGLTGRAVAGRSHWY
jgi:hypothetical protein